MVVWASRQPGRRLLALTLIGRPAAVRESSLLASACGKPFDAPAWEGDMIRVPIGAIDLPVAPEAAATQRVRISTRWREALTRTTPTAPALPPERVEHLTRALDEALDENGRLPRSVLYQRASAGPLDEAMLLVMAWGLGTTGRWNNLTPLVRRACNPNTQA